MKQQCTYCDKFVSKEDLNLCRKNHHEIIDVLDEEETVEKNTILNFAQSPNILEEWKQDVDPTHIGDDKNKVLVAILLVSSKRKNHEQAVIIQKQSSAGGTNLQRTVLEYFNNKITLTRMTGAYLDRSKIDYSGKILAIGEMSGFDSTSASLRQKLSEGKTELGTTDKD